MQTVSHLSSNGNKQSVNFFFALSTQTLQNNSLWIDVLSLSLSQVFTWTNFDEYWGGFFPGKILLDDQINYVFETH